MEGTAKQMQENLIWGPNFIPDPLQWLLFFVRVRTATKHGIQLPFYDNSLRPAHHGQLATASSLISKKGWSRITKERMRKEGQDKTRMSKIKIFFEPILNNEAASLNCPALHCPTLLRTLSVWLLVHHARSCLLPLEFSLSCQTSSFKPGSLA